MLVEFHLIHMAKQGYMEYESNQKYMMEVSFQYAKVMSMNISFNENSFIKKRQKKRITNRKMNT